MKFRNIIPAALLAASMLTVSVSAADVDVLDLSYSDFNIKYNSFEIIEDDTGNDALVIHYDFTNSSSEPKSAFGCYSLKAYQNGVELDRVTPTKNMPSDYGNVMKEVMDGGTIGFSWVYSISDMSDIKLQAHADLDYSVEDQMMVLSISDGSDVSGETEPDYKTMYEELLKEYEKLQADYEELKLKSE